VPTSKDVILIQTRNQFQIILNYYKWSEITKMTLE